MAVMPSNSINNVPVCLIWSGGNTADFRCRNCTGIVLRSMTKFSVRIKMERNTHAAPQCGSMEYSSCRSNLLKGLLYCCIRAKKIKNENTAEIPCAIRVAIAAPNTPRPSPATIQRSIKIFRMDEKISSPSGILDSPIEVNMLERMLYINRKRKAHKIDREIQILDDAVLYLRVYFVGFPFLFMYNILSTMFTSIGESKIPLGLLIFSSILNILMDLWMVAGLGLGVFGAAIATLIAQGISAVFSFLIFFARMQQYKSPFNRFERQELYSMLRIAVPSVLSFAILSGRKISLMQRSTMQDAISAPKIGGIVRLTKFSVQGTLFIELLGMTAMLPVFFRDYGIKGIWMAAFHSVSAFCNAGFDLLQRFYNYPQRRIIV